jgi:hypothetical protein
MASGGGGTTSNASYGRGRGAGTPTIAQQRASSAGALAATQAKAASAKAVQIKALEEQMGGRPAWVDKFNQTYKGKYVINPTIDNGQLAYVTNNLQYYNPQGTYLHAADYGPKGLVYYVGEYLPILETLALSAVGVPPAIAGALVSAANGGNIEQIAKAALGGYIGGQVSSGVSSTVTSAGTSAGINASVLKIVSSAAGADAGAVASSLAQGKTLDESLKIGTKSAVVSAATSIGNVAETAASGLVEDPALSKIIGTATKAGTTAAITGQDVGKAALTAAKDPLLDYAGDTIRSAADNVDLSGVKSAIQPISDVVTKVTQPISDVATKVFQPLEAPIKSAVQSTSDALTAATKPLSDAFASAKDTVKSGVQSASDSFTTATKPVGDALSSAKDNVKSTITSATTNLSENSKNALDKAIIDIIEKPFKPDTPAVQPIVSDVASGSAASPAAFSGADVAMLGDTSEAGLGSKVSKKGGKYPFGEPEGTSALKEGLGIG